MTLQANIWSTGSCKRKAEWLSTIHIATFTSNRRVSVGTSRRFDLYCSIADDTGESCLCRTLFTHLLFLFDSPLFPQIFGQNRVIAFLLGLTLAVEVVIGGIAISTTSPPPPSAGPLGSAPPCGAVMGPFGWLVSFWVRKRLKIHPYNILFFLRFL